MVVVELLSGLMGRGETAGYDDLRSAGRFAALGQGRNLECGRGR